MLKDTSFLSTLWKSALFVILVIGLGIIWGNVQAHQKSCSAGAGFGIGSTDGADILEVGCEYPVGSVTKDRHVKGFYTKWTSFEDEDVTGTVDREVCERVKRYGRYREVCNTVTDTVVVGNEDSANSFVGAAYCSDWRANAKTKYGGCLGGVYFIDDTIDTDEGFGGYLEGRLQYSTGEGYSVEGSIFHGSSFTDSDKGITGVMAKLKRWF